MLKKVLIANRGEIALRIIRGCYDAGIETVAVYHIDDKDEDYIKLADESYLLEGTTVEETYLNVDLIVSIAKKFNADAVHPGYGFISENADAAKKIRESDLIWIGPTEESIRSLGNKVTAKKIAQYLLIPIVPGIYETIDIHKIKEFIDINGLPIILKASLGGGGRGMRVIENSSDLDLNYQLALDESIRFFNSSELFVEKYLINMRHIEVQAIADQCGHISILGLRDCTLQRRKQKLLEESPVINISDELCYRLYEYTEKLIQYTNYINVITCEFLVSDDDIFFIEANTRLQVEHTITEVSYNIDIVDLMLRVADKQCVDLGVLSPIMHTIEVRINGEDENFIPQSGLLKIKSMGLGPSVRVDMKSEKFISNITPLFDSLLCKIIVSGSSREIVLRRLSRTLKSFKFEGIKNNIDLFRYIINHEDKFKNGTIYTTWLEDEIVERYHEYYDTCRDKNNSDDEENHLIPLTDRLPKFKYYSSDDTESDSNSIYESSGMIKSDMNSLVVKIFVSAGQRILKNDNLLILESMKMQRVIKSNKEGIISNIYAKEGLSVRSGDNLLEIE